MPKETKPDREQELRWQAVRATMKELRQVQKDAVKKLKGK